MSTNPLEAAEEALAAQIETLGSDIVLIDPDGAQTTLKAQIGQSSNLQQAARSGGGAQTAVRTVDFLVVTAQLAALLPVNTSEITRGWKIEFSGQTFQPGSWQGEPLSRPSGRFGLVTRIHTHRVQ